MSESDDQEHGAAGDEPFRPPPSRPSSLRRGLFGYRRRDVEVALDARDAELDELRQDVAALWLAFAQHDRMIRGAPAPAPAAAAEPPRDEPGRPAAAADSGRPPTATGGGETDPVESRLTELDDVLAAIESATRTLGEAYVEESGKPPGEQPDPPGAGGGRQPD